MRVPPLAASVQSDRKRNFWKSEDQNTEKIGMDSHL